MTGNAKNRKPPKIAESILKRLLPDTGWDTPLGDFEEDFNEMAVKKGNIRAVIWYFLQIIKIIPGRILNSMKWNNAMFKNYLKISMRNLLKQKAYSGINISGLAIGIASCVLIFLWIRDELSYDTFHVNSDRIYRTRVEQEGNWWTASPWAFVPILKNDYPDVDKASRVANRNTVLKYQGISENFQGVYVDRDFFEMFTFPLTEGDPASIFQSNSEIILTQEKAVFLFGEEEPIGKIVNVNNQDLTVTGIVNDPPENSTIRFDFIAPVLLFGNGIQTSWSSGSFTFILLNKNVNVNDFRYKISDITTKYDTVTGLSRVTDIENITDIRLYNMNGQDPVVYLYMFASIAAIILLLACTNYVVLTTARAGNRTKEIGIRKVTGAYKKDLVMQFFGESMLLITFAGLIGIITVYLLLPWFNALSSKNLTLNFAEDITLLYWLAAIIMFAGIMSGSYPAVVLSSFKPVNILKGQLSLTSSRSILRKTLVVGQFAITAILIASTLVMFRQIDFMLNKDLGFSKENVLVFALDNNLRGNYDTIKEELLKSQDVINVSSASSLPLNLFNNSQVIWEKRTRADQITMRFAVVDYDYFKTFNMRFIEGRTFSREMSTDTRNYVINEETAKLMQLKDSPVGKMFSLRPNEGQVLGVVKNFNSRSLHNDVVPLVFTMNWQSIRNTMFVKINDGKNSEVLSFIQSKFDEIVQGTPFNYTYMEDTFSNQYSSDRQMFSILRNFAILAIFISSLGILGLAAFLAEKRIKEIGIRKVLGASAESIAILISKEFIYLIIIANIIGLPGSLFLIDWLLESYAFRTDIPFWIFIGAGVFTLTIAFITVSLQTLKAAMANPVNSMKYE